MKVIDMIFFLFYKQYKKVEKRAGNPIFNSTLIMSAFSFGLSYGYLVMLVRVFSIDFNLLSINRDIEGYLEIFFFSSPFLLFYYFRYGYKKRYEVIFEKISLMTKAEYNKTKWYSILITVLFVILPIIVIVVCNYFEKKQ